MMGVVKRESWRLGAMVCGVSAAGAGLLLCRGRKAAILGSSLRDTDGGFSMCFVLI